MTYEYKKSRGGLGRIDRGINKKTEGPIPPVSVVKQENLRNRVSLRIEPCPPRACPPIPGAAYAELIEWIPDHGPRVVARIDGLDCYNGRTRTYVFDYETRFGYRYQVYVWNLTHQTSEFYNTRHTMIGLQWKDGRLVIA